MKIYGCIAVCVKMSEQIKVCS